MKKQKSKTDDLLKRLGASLKDSPLNAWARGRGETEALAAPAPVMTEAEATTAVKEKTPAPRVSAKGQGTETPKRTTNVKAASATTKPVVGMGAPVKMQAKESSAAVMANERQHEEEAASVAKPVVANDLLEGLVQTMVQGATTLENDQVRALQQAPESVKAQVQMQGGAPTNESLEATLEKLGVPLSERQRQQLKELQAMKEALAEIKQLQEQQRQREGAAPAPRPAPTPLPWQTMPAGSTRMNQNGWRTSTVGLYPEDYDKAYEIMTYLRQQTGQVVNLSRVMKIALRALEVGPRVLEVNAQVRAKDGRLLSRRG